MSNRKRILKELIDLSRWLGEPEQDCAILGEGNTSARISDDTYLVKASGTELRTLNAAGLVEISFSGSSVLLENPGIDDRQIKKILLAAKVHPSEDKLPSIETALHGICLSLEGVNFVGHTHPTAINAITCSAALIAMEVMDFTCFAEEPKAMNP